LQHVAIGEAPLVWLGEYVRLELALLELAGFGLDLNSCAATGGTEQLSYVSPKSGRAVSQVAGQPYHDRMLTLPEFIKDAEHSPESLEQVGQGIALTGYFLETRLLPALHRKPPALRAHFVALLARKTAA
jgi:DNA repair protein RecO (recombination protein O)